MFFTKKERLTKQMDPTRPYIVINFKTYKEATGEKAAALAKICERVQAKTHINMIVCPQAYDLKEIAETVKIPVYAQHVDAQEVGKSTGALIPDHLMQYNIHGSLINHSEKRLLPAKIQKTILKLKELDLVSIVCVKNVAEAKKYAHLKLVPPTFIAVEPPELIGGEISVSNAKPDVIKKAVQAVGTVPLLVGAGVKSNQDVKLALQYGAKGVLLASHFVLAQDPEKFLMDLIQGV